MIKEIKKELSKFLKGLKFESEALQAEQVKISDRVVGAKVELIDGEGNLTPIPDGEYKVDEFEFTVKDGVISEIKGEAKPEEKPEEEMKQEFEDVKALQIGDEVNISPEAKEYMPWYEGVGFVVNSLDGYGDGMVGLSNNKGFYVTYVKAESVTKTGNKVELPKDEQFAKDDSETKVIEDMKAETESLKKEVAAFKEIINQLANKTEVEEFKSEVVKLNKTLETIANTPAQFSKTDKSPINKEKNDNAANTLINLMKKK